MCEVEEFFSKGASVARTKKEAIYDKKIAPLMTKIIDICNKHKIANLCSFDLGPNPEEDDESHLACTTVMLDDDFEPDEKYAQAANLILG